MSKEVECPYCEHEFDLDHDDGAYYYEDRLEEATCPECEKVFVVSVYISHSWTGQRADCLNGSDHKWNEWRRMWEGDTPETIGKVFEYRRCQDCDLEEKEWHISPPTNPTE